MQLNLYKICIVAVHYLVFSSCEVFVDEQAKILDILGYEVQKMKYLTVGKNSKGFFLSHEEKILMECIKLEHIQAVAPLLEADGIVIQCNDNTRFLQQMPQALSLS
jgi:hypothetical protein